MKFLIALIFILSVCLGAFSQSTEQAKYQSSPPIIIFKHAKSRHKQLKSEVLNKIINPLICRCRTPIDEIIIDFCPEILGEKEGERGCQNEAKGELTISITVNRWDGSSGVNWIEINKNGSIDKYEYLKIFSSDTKWCPPNKDCASTDKQER